MVDTTELTPQTSEEQPSLCFGESRVSAWLHTHTVLPRPPAPLSSRHPRQGITVGPVDC